MNTTLKLAALAALVACGTISALPSQADELPKNPSGKILKRELRTTHADLAKETNR